MPPEANNKNNKTKALFFIFGGLLTYPLFLMYSFLKFLKVLSGPDASIEIALFFLILSLVTYIAYVKLISDGIDIFLTKRRIEKPNSYTPSDFFVSFFIFLALYPYSIFVLLILRPIFFQ